MSNGVAYTTSTTAKSLTSMSGALAAFRDGRSVTGSSQTLQEAGVEQHIYLKYIKGEIDREKNCMELPITIMLLLSFTTLSYWHLNQEAVFAVEQAIELDIIENANFAWSHYFGHKGLYDVYSFADVWSWVRIGFVPLVVQPAWAYSEQFFSDARDAFPGTSMQASFPNQTWQLESYGGAAARPVPLTGDYLHYNRIIGGVRFRQQVAPQSESFCRWPRASFWGGAATDGEDWARWYGKPCVPAEGELTFKPTSADAEGFTEPERVEWLFTDLDPLSKLLEHVVDMEDGCAQMAAKGGRPCHCEWCRVQEPTALPWIDERTKRIEISFATYNSEYGLLTLTGVNLFFNRGSTIFKRVELMSTWIDFLARPLGEVIIMCSSDIIWGGLLLYISVNEVLDVIHVIRDADGKGPMAAFRALYVDYLGFWNMVDWASIFVFLIVAYQFTELFLSTHQIHGVFEQLVRAKADHAGLEREPYIQLVVDFYDKVESLCTKERSFRLTLCFYPAMAMARLFKSFAAQDRLAVVTNTLVDASQDMIHFGIVFLSVFFCFCLQALILFGQDVYDFTTMFRSINTCFRIMFGDWDWEPMEEVNREFAWIWFTLFMMLIVIILLNMLLAIIMDNYMNVKNRSMKSKTLPAQMMETWRRYRQSRRKERVTLNHIYKVFMKLSGYQEKKMLASTAKIDVQFLLDNVDGIPVSQAQRTLKNSWKEHEKENEDPFKWEDVEPRMEIIDRESKTARDFLYYTYDRVDFYNTVPTRSSSKDRTPAAAGGKGARASSQLRVAPEPQEMPSNEKVLNNLTREVDRLTSESASNLAETVRRVDNRQRRIEARQDEMLNSSREMLQNLLTLQSEASALVSQMDRLDFDRRTKEASTWRKGMAGKTYVPGIAACTVFDCAVPDTREAPLPPLKGSVGPGLALT